jgi:chemotaxis protein MotB
MTFPAGTRRLKGAHGAAGGEHDEGTWIFSYADMITILMIFFILMLSISNVSPEKFSALQSAIKGESDELQGVDPTILQSVKVSDELRKLAEQNGPTLAGIPLDAVAKKAAETGGDRLAQLSAGVRILLDSVSKDFIERDIRQAAEFERLKAELTKLSQSSQNQALTKARATEISITVPKDEVFDAKGRITQTARAFARSLVVRMKELESRPSLRIETHAGYMDGFRKRTPSEARLQTIAQGSLLVGLFVELGADPSLVSAAAYGFKAPLVDPQTVRGNGIVDSPMNDRVVLLLERRPMEIERSAPKRDDSQTGPKP